MPTYEDDDRFQPIAPIQPVRRIRAVRAIRQMRPRPYLGNRNMRPTQATSALPDAATSDGPAAILDISPQAREQAHHLTEE